MNQKKSILIIGKRSFGSWGDLRKRTFAYLLLVARSSNNQHFFISSKNIQRNVSHTHSLSNFLDILEEKLMTRQLKVFHKEEIG